MRWRVIRKVLLVFSVLALLLPADLTFARTYGQRLCKEPGFSCHRVRGRQSWESLFPNDHDRGIVMRLNRMNTSLYPGLVIAIPNNLSEADIMDFAPFPRSVKGLQEKLVVVDTFDGAWGAYDKTGELLRWGPASSGRDYCNDIDAPCETHSGSFRVFSLGDMDCVSRKFPIPEGGAPMPYCMYFNNGQALHGEPRGLPGYNDSHGCVRLYVTDAEWLRYEFIEGPNADNHFRGTKVVVR